MDNVENQDVNLTNDELELDLGTEDQTQDQRDWKAEALKQQAIAKRLKAKLDKKVEPPQINNNVEPPKALDILKDEAFALYREGYTNDEIDLIIRNGGRKILDDQSNPLSLGLKVAKEQRQAEEAASRTNSHAGGDPILKKVSVEDLNKMSKEELEQILPHAD